MSPTTTIKISIPINIQNELKIISIIILFFNLYKYKKAPFGSQIIFMKKLIFTLMI